MNTQTVSALSALRVESAITVRYTTLREQVDALGGRDQVLSAISELMHRGCTIRRLLGELGHPTDVHDSDRFHEMHPENACIRIVAIAQDMEDPLILHISFRPYGFHQAEITKAAFDTGKLRLGYRAVTLVQKMSDNPDPRFFLKQIITFDVLPGKAPIRVMTPEKILFDKMIEIEGKTRNICGNSYVKEVHRIASQAISDYGDAVMPSTYPVQWNAGETVVEADACKDHPDVQPAIYHLPASQLAIQNGANTIDHHALEYIGYIQTPTAMFLVYPGDWIVQTIRGRYEVYPNELFMQLF